MLTVDSHIHIPDAEFEWTYARSSGPGGQNVNKVSSKAVLRWNVLASPSLPAEVRARFLKRFGSRLTTDGHLLITSQRYRDQGRNVSDALEKLTAMLTEVARPPKRRRPTKPTKGSVTRRLESKQARSRTKQTRRRPAED